MCILEAWEMAMLSMLENIFYKTLHRIVGKKKECEAWNGKICPNIRKNWTSSLNSLKIVVWYLLVEAYSKLLVDDLKLDTMWTSKAGVLTAVDGS